jgi:hypothetical protein
MSGGKKDESIFDEQGVLKLRVKPLHNLHQWPEEAVLHPDFGKVSNNSNLELYSEFPFLSPEFSTKLLEEIEHFCSVTGDSGIALRLEHLGLHDLFADLIRKNQHAFPKSIAELSPGFGVLPKVMLYRGENENTDWPAHIDGPDDSTINVCLTSDFEGSNLRIFFDDEKDTFTDLVHKSVGHAIHHSGLIRHKVTQLISGKRCTLIIKIKS